MPIIPRVSGPTVERQIVSQPRAQVQDVSSGLQSVAKGISQVGLLAQELDQRKVQSDAENALINFTRAKTETLFGADGYYNTVGRNAVEGYEPTNKRLDELVKEHAKGLDPRAANLFQKAVNNAVVRDQQDLLTHRAKQQTVMEIGNLQAERDQAIEQGGAYYNTPETRQAYYVNGQKAVAELAEKQGLDTAETNLMITRFQSDYAFGLISGALAREDVTAASELMRGPFGQRLTGQNRDRAESLILSTENKVAIRTAADEIFVPGASLMAMQKQVRDNDAIKPEHKDAVLELIEKRDASHRRGVAQYESDQVDKYAGLLRQGGFTTDSINVQEWDGLSEAAKKALLIVEKEQATGVFQITDNVKYWGLITGKTDQEIAKLVPYEHYEYLNDRERQELDSLVMGARKAIAGGTKDRNYTSAVSRATETKTMLESMYNRTIGPTDSDFVNWFQGKLNDRVQAEEDATGKQITPQRFTEILGKFASQAKIPGRGYRVPLTQWTFSFGGKELDIRAVKPEHREKVHLAVTNAIGANYGMDDFMEMYQIMHETGEVK